MYYNLKFHGHKRPYEYAPNYIILRNGNIYLKNIIQPIYMGNLFKYKSLQNKVSIKKNQTTASATAPDTDFSNVTGLSILLKYFQIYTAPRISSFHSLPFAHT